VQFADEEAPVWVAAKYVSSEVVEDFEAGLEYSEAAEVVDVRNRGDCRAYLVRWGDGYPDSWEPEENVAGDLVTEFEARRAEAAARGNGAAAPAPA
jgi:signal recognition particle protein